LNAPGARLTFNLIRCAAVSFVSPLRLLLALTLCLQPLDAQTLETLSQAYRDRPSAAAKRNLLNFASSHEADKEGALALLVVGSREAVDGESGEAIAHLRAVGGRLPSVQDYVSYYLARALYDAGQYQAAITELEKTISHSPPSPLEPRAVLLAARVYLDSGDSGPGVSLLREYMKILPQPDGWLLLGQCQEAAGDPGAAVDAYQHVYYGHPVTDASRQALPALTRIRRQLGRDYPPIPAQLKFTRVERLMRIGEHLMAREELQDMTVRLGGTDRDRARVWLGRARYEREHDSVAYKWLRQLRVGHPEVEAERLYYLLETARRLKRTSEVLRAIQDLNENHRDSPWRLRGLVSAGNMYLLTNSHEEYLPFYGACAEAFPAHARAAYCDWKVVWSHYIRRQPDAPELFRGHLRDFPFSKNASAALYFLGRLAEESGDLPAAGAYYREIEHEYPNYYYAYRARERLSAAGSGANADSEEVLEFLDGIEFPARRHEKSFEPTELTAARLERARTLFAAELRDWGESELRYGSRTGAQGPILAVELAESASKRGDHGTSLRYIKGLAPGYLTMPFESAPESFWRLAFPLPYRATLEKYSGQRELDPFFVAALIRQESEFNPRAVSRARAYGLTQVLPSTGRQISRKAGVRGFRTAMLYEPDVNVNMGTYYLRAMIDDLDGHTEAALAAYNAGKSRASAWLTWAEFREPAEFVETIPFTETRNYVMRVTECLPNYRARLTGETEPIRFAGELQRR